MKPTFSHEIQNFAERQAAHCRVMGNSQRILIMWLLEYGEQTVSEIAEAIGASLQSTSHHLRILEFSNMVRTRRERHNVYYHIIDNEIVKHCPAVTKTPLPNWMETVPESEINP